MNITLEYLIERNACRDEVELFLELFGTECELNWENLEKYVKRNRYAFRGLHWFATWILTSNQLIEFVKLYYKEDKSDPDVFAMKVGRKLIKLLAEENGEKL